MPKLSNVTLKAMALTGNPANRRPIHLKKNATEEKPMTDGHADETTTEALSSPSAEVLKALGEVKLTKAAGDADHEAAAEAVGRLLAAHPSLTHEDVLAVAKAAGLSATAKSAAEEEDEDEELEDETDEDEASDHDEATDKKGKFKKGNPWAEKMKKSADGEFETVLKNSAPVEVQKAVEAMRKSYEVRIAKAERIIAEERDHRVTNLIKSEVEGAFRHLAIDSAKLTSVIKHARESGRPEHAKDLMQVLKSAEAQVALASKSGGAPFQSVGKSSQFGAASGGSAMDQINAHVDAMVAKSGSAKSRPQMMDEFTKTAEGRALAAQLIEERGF